MVFSEIQYKLTQVDSQDIINKLQIIKQPIKSTQIDYNVNLITDNENIYIQLKQKVFLIETRYKQILSLNITEKYVIIVQQSGKIVINVWKIEKISETKIKVKLQQKSLQQYDIEVQQTDIGILMQKLLIYDRKTQQLLVYDCMNNNIKQQQHQDLFPVDSTEQLQNIQFFQFNFTNLIMITTDKNIHKVLFNSKKNKLDSCIIKNIGQNYNQISYFITIAQQNTDIDLRPYQVFETYESKGYLIYDIEEKNCFDDCLQSNITLDPKLGLIVKAEHQIQEQKYMNAYKQMFNIK